MHAKSVLVTDRKTGNAASGSACRIPYEESLEEPEAVPVVEVRGRSPASGIAVVRRVTVGEVLLGIEANRFLEFLRYRDHVRKLVLGVLKQRLGGAVDLPADFLFVMAGN